MLEEKVFKRIMIGITIFIILFVAISYIGFYKKQPNLTQENIGQNQEQEKTKLDVPIEPFEVFSMVKENLVSKFGKGTEGDGSDVDNQYNDYEQQWFGKKFKARYYNGLQTRVYQINLKLNKEDLSSVYRHLQTALGKSVKDSFLNTDVEDLDQRITYWIKDGVRYSMLYDEGQPFVKMFMEYYSNPDGHDLGDRPIVIQREDNVDSIVEGEKATILLIGDKKEYTSKYYKNLYLLIGTKKGSFVGKMTKDSDGGLYPKLTLPTIGESKKIVVETDNEYTKWYTTFEFKNNKLNVVSSSEKDPTKTL